MPSHTIIFLTGFALVIFWAVGAHNRLIRLKNRIAEVFAPIDLQLKRRYELVPNLIEAIRTQCPDAQKKQVQAALDTVGAARNQASSACDSVRIRPSHARAVLVLCAAEHALHSGLGSVFALTEAIPELQANNGLQQTREEMDTVEKTVDFARQAFNDAVRDYNHAQGQFPALLIARIFGFTPAAAF